MEEKVAERVTAVRISRSRVRSKSSSEHTEVLWGEGWRQNTKALRGSVWTIRTESRELAELHSCVRRREQGRMTLTLGWSVSQVDLGREIYHIYCIDKNNLNRTASHLHLCAITLCPLCFNCAVWKMTNTHKDAGLPSVLTGTWHMQRDTQTQILTPSVHRQGLIHTSQLKSQPQAHSVVTFQQFCQREVTHFLFFSPLSCKPVSDLPPSSLLFSLHHMSLHTAGQT